APVVRPCSGVATHPRRAGGLDAHAGGARPGARGVRLRDPRLPARDAGERRPGAGAGERRRGAGGEGAGHPEGPGAPGPGPARAHRRASPGRSGEQRRRSVGRLPLLPALLRLLPPPAAAGGDRMTRRASRVLGALQATILLLPLFLGGRQAVGLAAAWIVVTALLVLTLVERRRAGHPTTPGAWALAAFLGLGLVTALPLPPWLIERLAPVTAQLYRDVLSGRPGGGGWRALRSLALDPLAVWTQLSTLAVGLGAYLVLVGYPWGDEAARARVFGRIFLTVVGGGVAIALLALLAEVAGNGRVMWVSDEPVIRGRLAAPFVNPNHLACWLEMGIPA